MSSSNSFFDTVLALGFEDSSISLGISSDKFDLRKVLIRMYPAT
jgi:hypothetical protein